MIRGYGVRGFKIFANESRIFGLIKGEEGCRCIIMASIKGWGGCYCIFSETFEAHT